MSNERKPNQNIDPRENSGQVQIKTPTLAETLKHLRNVSVVLGRGSLLGTISGLSGGGCCGYCFYTT